MGYTTIAATVNDQSLQLANLPVLASGGADEIKFVFTFCELWADATKKTAVFFRNKVEVYHKDLDGSDACLAPGDPFAAGGVVFVGVFAEYANGTTRTSEAVALDIVQGAITKQTAAANAPDIYAALEAKVASLDHKVSGLSIAAMDDGAGNVTLTIG